MLWCRAMAGCIMLVVLTSAGSFVCGQEKYELEPIRYSESKPQNNVQQLVDRVVDGSLQLQWDAQSGYLKSVLQELNVPQSSQSLVFSKTSLQVSHISPRTPRAIYFNDDIYVGWVPNGDVIEISAADPALGATFYSLKQISPDRRKLETELKTNFIKRETSRCLQCHDSTRTGGRPGHMVRSVYPLATGQPEYSLGTMLSTHESKFSERFGGWFVTGTHGEMRHLGNAWILESPNANSFRRGNRKQEELDTESGANMTDLSRLVDVKRYLTPHSDIVAQLVLQHQVYMHNLITEANYLGRQAIHDARTMNKIFGRPADFESDSTSRRFDRAADAVLHGLLFCDEAKLEGPIKGTSTFADEFQKRGPFANQAGESETQNVRSLRELDMQTRLFRYPCSFLIYSDAFQSLPQPVLSRVYQRLVSVLDGTDTSDTFSHLDTEMRNEIREILLQTGIEFSK